MTKRQIKPTFEQLGQDAGVRERSEQRFGEAPAHLQNTTIKQKVRGYITITGPDIKSEGETCMCMHCGFHWVIQPGSGIARGFCMNCFGPTCGKRECEATCIPLERAIEERERIDQNLGAMRRNMR